MELAASRFFQVSLEEEEPHQQVCQPVEMDPARDGHEAPSTSNTLRPRRNLFDRVLCAQDNTQLSGDGRNLDKTWKQGSHSPLSSLDPDVWKKQVSISPTRGQRLFPTRNPPPLLRWTLVLSVVATSLSWWMERIGGGMEEGIPKCWAPVHSDPLHSTVSLRSLVAYLSPFLLPIHHGATWLQTLQYLVNLLLLVSVERSLGNLQYAKAKLPVLFQGALAWVCGKWIRQLLAILFTRITGWSYPKLFFHEAMYECSTGMYVVVWQCFRTLSALKLGIYPILLPLLFLQAFALGCSEAHLLNGKYAKSRVQWGNDHGQLLAVHVCIYFLNAWIQPAFWTTLSAIITGLLLYSLQWLVQRTPELFSSPWMYKVLDLPKRRILPRRPSQCLDLPIPIHNHDSLWFLLRFLAVGMFVIAVLPSMVTLALISIHTPPSSLLLLNALEPTVPFLFTILVITAPRRNQDPVLIETIASYLDEFPSTPADPLYHRTRMSVYSPRAEHTMFDLAKQRFSGSNPSNSITAWYQDSDQSVDQHKHFADALAWAFRDGDTLLTMIVEDDFPLCEGAWRDLVAVVERWQASGWMDRGCGAFVGTGGSGLILHRDIANTLIQLLHQASLDRDKTPTDILLQNCLLGNTPACTQCQGTLMISKTLLMRHAGWGSSTHEGREYTSAQFQCEWRHPFHGYPGIKVA